MYEKNPFEMPGGIYGPGIFLLDRYQFLQANFFPFFQFATWQQDACVHSLPVVRQILEDTWGVFQVVFYTIHIP